MSGYWTSGQGRRVGVAGLGRSGRAAARLLSVNGFRVAGFDSDESVPDCEWCAEEFRGDDQTGGLDGLEGLVLSPGIPPSSALPSTAAEAGIPVIGEIELAFRHCQAPVLAVTGSNGKTTTSEWLGHVLRSAGMRAVVAGNTGYPFSRAILEDAFPDWFVLELSSYQLETIETFRPAGAAVLNLTPDHLQRHGGMEGYGSAKARIFMNQHSEDLTVLNPDDPGSVALMGRTAGLEAHFSILREVRDGAFCTGDVLYAARDGRFTPVIARGGVSIPGRHNLANALAVVCLAGRAGLDAASIAGGLSSFPGVEHRIEFVRTLDGVDWYNDSKSTNQDSLKVALESFDRPVVLIAGGLSKKTDYASLAPLVAQRARAVILIGDASAELRAAWEGSAPMTDAGDMAAAVRLARETAREGEVVLLSPACASFDQYADFEHRGRHFKELVGEL
jgi:UDP-N-acetylmuramoylalanine--D-glutamate ligase